MDAFLGNNGQLVIEAENTTLRGDWVERTVDGETTVLWDAERSIFRYDDTQALTYLIEPDATGTYNISLHSARVQEVMRRGDLFDENGDPRTDTGNDAFVEIRDAENNQGILFRTKLFTGSGSTDEVLRWGTTFDRQVDGRDVKSPAQVQLQGGRVYRLFIGGRSDGYALDRITLSTAGFLEGQAGEAAPQSQQGAPTGNINPFPPTSFQGPLVTLALYDTDTDTVIQGYENLTANAQIDLNGLDVENYSIIAQVNPNHPNAQSVESIRFTATPPQGGTAPTIQRVDDVAPYALFDDPGGDFAGEPLTVGTYSIQVTAYAQDGGTGRSVEVADFSYSVIDSTPLPPEPPAPEPPTPEPPTPEPPVTEEPNTPDPPIQEEPTTPEPPDGGGDGGSGGGEPPQQPQQPGDGGGSPEPPTEPPVGRIFGRIIGDKGNNILLGGDGPDRMVGSLGNDRLRAGGANDHLLGGSGRDLLVGGDGDDILRGGTGPDRLFGGRGNDRLYGGGGNDKLVGGKDNDQLTGGGGNDRLNGGAGNDLITTGAGRDRIVLRRNGGFDRVVDFNVNRDKIDLVGGVSFGQLSLSQRQDNVLVKIGNRNVLVLEGVDLADVTQADFV